MPAVLETAKDVMQRDVLTVGERWTIAEALRLFTQRRISGAPVVDAAGNLVGVISLSDIARAAVGRERKNQQENDFYRTTLVYDFPSDMPVEPYDEIPVCEVMTPLVIDASEDLPVPRLAALMVDLHIHRVIITRAGKIVGIVSSLDVLKVIRNQAKRP